MDDHVKVKFSVYFLVHSPSPVRAQISFYFKKRMKDKKIKKGKMLVLYCFSRCALNNSV